MVGDVIATEGDVESAAPIPLPVTIGEIVPPPVAKFRLALTVVVVVGVNRTVTVWLVPGPLRENGLPDVTVNGAATDTAPEIVPPPVFDTTKAFSVKLPRLTPPKLTVPDGFTAKSARATALAAPEQALSLPTASTAVTATL